MLVPDAIGRIELDTTQIQGVSLDGLEQHSHVWISFLFHTNTNTARLSGMNAAPTPGKGGRPPRRKVFPAKVAPPALGGRRVGVFSTRSPHRPNPVGLTLVRLERVDCRRGVLHVSGLDLVNGTPVIDIKPYMPRMLRAWWARALLSRSQGPCVCVVALQRTMRCRRRHAQRGCVITGRSAPPWRSRRRQRQRSKS